MMNAIIDEVINRYEDLVMAQCARSELAALRATVEAQARQLEQARHERDMAVIACRAVCGDLWKDLHLDVIEMVMSVIKSDDARAANAPAPDNTKGV